MSGIISRRYVQTRSGCVHLAEAGTGLPVLLLHQTPRSWDEYRDALPLIGQHYRAIAPDTRGFGSSDPLPDPSIETWAEAMIDLADALELDRFFVAGHHTGAVIALEIAAQAQSRIAGLVLSSMSFVDAERRARHATHRVVDEVERQTDGSHLTELWQRRAAFYPEANRVDLLERLVRDALKAGPLAAEGHRIVNRYRMETRIGMVRCPTLVLAPTEDPHAYPSARRMAAAIAGARVEDVPGAMVPFPDQMPEVFAQAVCRFVAETL